MPFIMARRVRIDLLLVEKGLCPTREKAQRAVMAGQVWVGSQRVPKPSTPVDEDAEVEVRGSAIPFVSRGGLKLEKALDEFGLDPAGLTALDLGASTGGFTDCLLQRGAARVIAVDVGKGQLDWKLRQDPRVTSLEKCNARYLTLEQIGGQVVDLATVDVSFISLGKIFPALTRLLAPGAPVVALVKPQFEAGRGKAPRGVVQDPQVHRQVLEQVLQEARGQGLACLGLTHSPVKGPAGNIEYLARFGVEQEKGAEPSIPEVVERAHADLR